MHGDKVVARITRDSGRSANRPQCLRPGPAAAPAAENSEPRRQGGRSPREMGIAAR
jgi:hypothetical protein